MTQLTTSCSLLFNLKDLKNNDSNGSNYKVISLPSTWESVSHSNMSG